MTQEAYPRADLHVHSTYSDGTYTVEKLIRRAENRGLSLISLTDHDTVIGIDEAIGLAAKTSLDVIPGIEFSSHFEETSIHVLGYFLNHHDPDLTDYLKTCADRRLKRTEAIVGKLQKLGYDVTLDFVLKMSGGGVVGRPHIASAVVERSDFPNMKAVFRDLLIQGKPAYVPKETFDTGQIIELIHASGGVASIAHPKTMGDDSLIPKLVHRDLDAIEVVHSSHSLRDIEKYSAMADQYNLVISGGSDCHGSRLGREIIGRYTISLEQVERLRSRIHTPIHFEKASD